MELSNIAHLTDADILVITEHHKGINKDLPEEEQFQIINNDKYLALNSFWCASKQRKQNRGGGVAIYWKKTLTAETWDGPMLPNNLKHAGLERLWLKVKCTTGHHAIGGMYMPNKYTNFRDLKKTKKFTNILEVLSKDLNAMGDTPFDLKGDFNVHLGDSP